MNGEKSPVLPAGADSDPLPVVMTADQLGALLGVSARVVRELAQRGIITRAAKGRYTMGESVAAYCAHLREGAAGRSDSTTLTAERIRVARQQADKLEMANAVARRELIPARDVESAWSSILRDVRSALLAVSTRCGSKLPHLTAHDVSTIDGEVRSALAALSNGD